MKWFEGDIPKAIQQAKSSKSIFIVFISGEDDKSIEMESFLHAEVVTSLVEANSCVAVKLLANSNECKFFSQISDTGLPLEVIGECKSHEDFLAKVKNAVEIQKRASESRGGTSQASSQLPAQQQQTSSVTSSVEASIVETQNEEDLNGAVAVAGNGDDGVVTEDKTTTTASLEDRVEKARQLLEQKREEKMKKEAEEEKLREKERRNIGLNVQKLRQQQKETDMLDAKMELKKDREEDKIARQRVKDDIERDRAEKAARYNKEKDQRSKVAEEAKKKKLLEQQAAQAEEQARKSDTARIQFRMPDGSSVTQQFPATDTFASVHQFITQHMGTSVNLSMIFPRRTFTPEDHSLTLQELQLAPSAAIMVIPGGVSTSVVRSSSGIFSFSGITWLLFAPVWFVWSIIGSLFRSSGSSSSASASTKSRPASASSVRRGDRDPESSNMPPSSSSRQEGPIRRFHNVQDDESDEDRATWNGNSTQQM